MAVHYRFSSRSEVLARRESERVSDVLGGLVPPADLSDAERRAFVAGISAARLVVDRQAAGRGERGFWMIYPAQNRFVVEQLTEHSKWPRVAVKAWAWLFEFARPGDGEVLVTREGLRERVGCSKRAMDGVLGELVEMGALIKLREPEPGRQGRGVVRLFINPAVGSAGLKGGAREAAARVAPALTVLDGGKRRVGAARPSVVF